jgi:lysine 2,3-aminomutase
MKLEFRNVEPFPGVALEHWRDWRWQFKSSLSTLGQFETHFELTAEERAAFARPLSFPVQATPYYAALAGRTSVDDPVRRMMIPRVAELDGVGQQVADPLGERAHSPRERVIHRYPDRILFLITDQCSLYCRYCLRKHFTGQGEAFVGSEDYLRALEYIRSASGVREIILSGGDPLTISDGRLERVLSDLRSVEHIEIIRIASRMPVVAPMRVTSELAGLLRRFKPVFFMTHFNHPQELSSDAAEALERLVDSGVPVFNQMVLLNGINNHPALVQALARRLLYLRVKPYYMFQCDPSEGTEHFRTSVEQSEEIQRELWGRLSGLAMANLSLDIPGGGGKVGLVPRFEVSREDGVRKYSGYDGVAGEYRSPSVAVETPELGEYLAEWNELKGQVYGVRGPDYGRET